MQAQSNIYIALNFQTTTVNYSTENTYKDYVGKWIFLDQRRNFYLIF